MNCYYCRDYLQKEMKLEDGHKPYAFCTEEEKKLWGDKTYGKQTKGNTHSIEYMQARLKEMAKEPKTI